MRDLGGKPMFAEERKLSIVDLVSQRGSVTVTELCEMYDVSPATIRNDLRDLEQTAKLLRTHGGAMARNRTGVETTLETRAVQNVEAKKAIARIAYDCIEDGDTIILDVGTTTYELARIIMKRRSVKIVTSDLKIGLLADDYPDSDIYLLGGLIRSGYHCAIGENPIRELKNLAVDKAFMGTNGFDIEFGASTPDTRQAELKRAMIAAASKNYILCDGDKMGKRSFARFATIDEIDVLVIDRISSRDIELLEESGIDVRTH
jgi:DeoR family fructose operon transcriptional repressor